VRPPEGREEARFPKDALSERSSGGRPSFGMKPKDVRPPEGREEASPLAGDALPEGRASFGFLRKAPEVKLSEGRKQVQKAKQGRPSSF